MYKFHFEMRNIYTYSNDGRDTTHFANFNLAALAKHIVHSVTVFDSRFPMTALRNNNKSQTAAA